MIIAVAAAALLYPVKKVFFSASGLNDYFSGVNHLLHGRVKKSAQSATIGTIKLTLTTVGAYVLARPFLIKSGFIDNTLEPISEFNKDSSPSSLCSVLQNNSLVYGSEAYRIAKFCKEYFKGDRLSYYDITKGCIQKFAQREDDSYKKWILKDPFAASFRTRKAFDKKHSNLKNNNTISVIDSCRKSDVDDYALKKINFLDDLIKLEDKAIYASNEACYNSFYQDSCEADIKKARP